MGEAMADGANCARACAANQVRTPTNVSSQSDAASQSQLSQNLSGARVLVVFGASGLFGQERANIEVIRSMATLGLNARFVLNDRYAAREIRPLLERMGFGCVSAPFGYHWASYLLGRRWYYLPWNVIGVMVTSWRLIREARRWKATHIYLMNLNYYSYVAPALAVLKQPLVYRAGDALSSHSFWHRWLSRRLLKRMTVLVCNSRHVLNQVVKEAPQTLDKRVIYSCPPRRQHVQHAEITLMPPAGAVVVAFIGQISRQKGVAILFDAVSQLISEGRNIYLVVAGEPHWGCDAMRKLKERINSLGYSHRVAFLGYVEDVSSILRKADIHVCPSIYDDPAPNVVLEAKQEGVPSVAFRKGGIPELVSHKTDGYLCDTCSSDSLANGIRYFLQDPGRREAAGVLARETLARRFGEVQFRRNWERVFKQTMKQ